MKKMRPHIDLHDFNPTPQKTRLCDHGGCEQEGEYRAPKSPHNLREYYWFCLEHIRDYNKSWDYYKDMPPEEIDTSYAVCSKRVGI
ncbi:DnaJ domain-containing protein [Candidatus Bealeia paramacronuclearis]|uniref:DnaJ domain-containing protein n=1 Tax=Candidatus Bealeia paramacronuclearis TaxID=1921001 RepID=A0ABZ2C4T1_9PROT|nr:DnaJ domain-containing protein [Candidatus Bealeia paramacronuclearis]